MDIEYYEKTMGKIYEAKVEAKNTTRLGGVFAWRSERDLLRFRNAKTKVRFRQAVAGNARPRCI